MITKLTSKVLSDFEAETIQCGLKHGIATRPSEPERMVIAGNIWHQIELNDLYENLMKKERLKTDYMLSSTLMLTSLIHSLFMISTIQNS